MAELEEATRRLQSALERLDRAVVAQAEKAAASAGAEGAGSDQELRAELDRKTKERERLQTAADEAGRRLDSALGRLNTILGD